MDHTTHTSRRGTMVVVTLLLAALALAAMGAPPTAAADATLARTPEPVTLDWSAYRAAQEADGSFAQEPVPTTRVQGADRVATAVAIAGRAFPDGADVVYLARADQFADALAAGTLTDGPILLVPSCGAAPQVVAEEIARLDVAEVVALGGEQAVCQALLDELAVGRGTDRVAGPDRFSTAAAIAARAFPGGAMTAYVADGLDSPDAVAGGALTDGPILLLPDGDAVPSVVTEQIQRLAVDRVVALGGTGAVADTQLLAAAGELPTSRLAGPSRFATAAAIATEAFPSQAGAIYLARGDVFADAVAAGSLQDGPVLLVPACGDLPAEAMAYLAAVGAAEVVALGGPNAVCDAMLSAAAAAASSAGPPPTDPPPTDPPPTDPPPTTPDAGTLYLSHFLGELIAVDLSDPAAVPRTVWERDPSQNRTEVPVLLGEREYVHTLEDFVVPDEGPGQMTFEVVIEGLDDGVERTRFPWGLAHENGFLSPHCLGAVNPSPDGELFIAAAWYSQTCGSEGRYIDMHDRSGAQVIDFDGRAFTDWTWTPDGDLLVVISDVTIPDAPDDSIVLGVLAREDLLAGDPLAATVLQTFPGGDETPFFPSVSPAGDQVSFTFAGERTGDLLVMPLAAGAEPRVVAQHDDKSLSWSAFSPDGSELVVAVYEYRQVGKDNRSTVRIPNDPGAPPIQLGGADRPHALDVPRTEGGAPDHLDVQGPFSWE